MNDEATPRRWLRTGRMEAFSDGVYAVRLSTLPFPTRLLAEYLGQGDAAQVAVTMYGVTLLVVVALLAVVWRYAVGAGLLRPDAADEEVAALTRRLAPGSAAACC